MLVLRSKLSLVVLAAAAMSTLSVAQAADLSALRRFEAGLWDIQSKDARDGGRTMCVADPLIFIQLAHAGHVCSRFVISSTDTSAVVHYSCPGSGSGQTEIRMETPRLMQIETQGMLQQTPFQLRYEARRIGDCATPKK